MSIRPCFRNWLLLLCLASWGCGATKVTRENCGKVRTGMSKTEVEQILGPSTQSYQGIVTWKGRTPDQRITIVFDEELRVSEKTCEGLNAP